MLCGLVSRWVEVRVCFLRGLFFLEFAMQIYTLYSNTIVMFQIIDFLYMAKDTKKFCMLKKNFLWNWYWSHCVFAIFVVVQMCRSS